jgi:anthranilate phosphoribosyltransferase
MSLSVVEAEALFGAMLDGAMDDAAITDVLVDMADRGESTSELVGAVRAIRARMAHIHAPVGAMDVAGTGGDGQHSLNISTAVALVVAACGVPMAKCGNRAASSLAGTADTLEALGLDVVRATEMAEATLADLGIGFIFAQKQVPILARIAPIRKVIGRKTMFNLVGPLLNMANVSRQLVGVPSPAVIPLYCAALAELGRTRAMVVSGEEALDELSISGGSRFACVGFSFGDGRVAPEDAGLIRHNPAALKGGDAAHNATELRKILLGTADQNEAYRDAVLLNAAAALIVAGEVDDWRNGVEEAREALDKGLALGLLECWVKVVVGVV